MPDAFVEPGTLQPQDGGLTVSLMSTGDVVLRENGQPFAISMPPLLALDVAARIISVAGESLRQSLVELRRATQTATPDIRIIKGGRGQ